MREIVFNPLENTVEMRVKGLLADRFIDLASLNGVVIANLQRLHPNEIRATIRVADIHKLRNIASKTLCKVYFSNRKGIMFVTKNIVKRSVLLFGLLCALAFICVFTQKIRIIDVYGENIDKTEILNELENYEIYPGIDNDGALFRQVENKFLTENPEYSYIALKNKGIFLDVYAVKKKETSKPYDPNADCDIVSLCDGVITSVKVFEGTAKVEPGQTVRKGQILIEGTKDGKKRAALGEVEAKVWYAGVSEIGIKSRKFLRTGQYNINRRLKIPVGYGIIDESTFFENSESEIRSIKLMDGFFLGIELETITEYETVGEYIALSYDELYETARCAAFEDALRKLPLGYVHSDVTYTGEIKNDRYICRCILQIERPVGQTKYY